MTRFRPCIDLHHGQVKQIVGGSLGPSPDGRSATLQTNWTSTHPARHYATLHRQHDLRGGHVILLGAGADNVAAATEALAAWPGGLQLGGGVTAENAGAWIARGADKVIVTSFLFPGARFSMDRLQQVLRALGGDRSRLVIDLSCRRISVPKKVEQYQQQQHRQDPDAVEGGSDGAGGSEPGWVVAMDRWATLTDMRVDRDSIAMLADHCAELLVHAADVEGKCAGIDRELVRRLGEWSSAQPHPSTAAHSPYTPPPPLAPSIIPITYAGGASSIADLDLVRELSGGRVDLTIGSALDIFGGKGVSFEECLEWNRRQDAAEKAGPV